MKEIRKLLAARRAPVATKLPSSDIPCSMRLLSDREIDEAKIAAFKHLENKCKDEGVDVLRFLTADPEAYDRERARQVVFRSTLQAPKDEEDDEPARFFSSAEAVRELDSVVIAALLNVYEDVQDVRTAHREIPEATIEAFLDTTKEDRTFPGSLSTLDARTLRALVRALVTRADKKE